MNRQLNRATSALRVARYWYLEEKWPWHRDESRIKNELKKRFHRALRRIDRIATQEWSHAE